MFAGGLGGSAQDHLHLEAVASDVRDGLGMWSGLGQIALALVAAGQQQEHLSGVGVVP